jgi:hypothetical protein
MLATWVDNPNFSYSAEQRSHMRYINTLKQSRSALRHFASSLMNIPETVRDADTERKSQEQCLKFHLMTSVIFLHSAGT